MVDWEIEPLGNHHVRDHFASGKQSLDDFIKHRVNQYEKRRIGKTFVAVPKGEHNVIGYYTIAAGSVQFQNLPPVVASKLPRHPIPTVLLARLAVDLQARGCRLGESLLMDALERVMKISRNVAVYAVEVSAIDENAATFYQKYGFISFHEQPPHVFLPTSTIESIFN